MSCFRIRCRRDRRAGIQHNLGLMRFGILMADFRTEQCPRNKRSACQGDRSTSKLLVMIVIGRRRFYMPVVGCGERLERERRWLGGLRCCVDNDRGNVNALRCLINFIIALELAPETGWRLRESIIAKR
jgi:hypothetical protein